MWLVFFTHSYLWFYFQLTPSGWIRCSFNGLNESRAGAMKFSKEKLVGSSGNKLIFIVYNFVDFDKAPLFE